MLQPIWEAAPVLLFIDQKMEAIRTAAEMSDGRERETIKIGIDLMKQLSAQAHQKELQKERPQGQTPKKENK